MDRSHQLARYCSKQKQGPPLLIPDLSQRKYQAVKYPAKYDKSRTDLNPAIPANRAIRDIRAHRGFPAIRAIPVYRDYPANRAHRVVRLLGIIELFAALSGCSGL